MRTVYMCCATLLAHVDHRGADHALVTFLRRLPDAGKSTNNLGKAWGPGSKRERERDAGKLCVAVLQHTTATFDDSCQLLANFDESCSAASGGVVCPD